MSLGMPLSRPMPEIAHGAHVIRVTDRNREVRVFYYVKFEKAILVFHGFQKTTRTTPRREILMARRRLKEVLDAQGKE